MISKKVTTSIVVIGLFAGLMGCGGGDNSDFRFVGGAWTGAVAKVQDDCTSLTSAATVNFVHSVNQNEDAIVMTDENQVQFVGNVVGDDGFSVDSDSSYAFNGMTCDLDTRYQYTDIDSDDDTSATVTLKLLSNCPDGTTCSVVYNGNAARNLQ